MKKIKICFNGNSSTTFVKRDLEILKKEFNVDFIEKPKIKSGLLVWLKYSIDVLKKVKNCQVTYSWFAGGDSAVIVFFSKLFRKKSIVVAGGYDAAYIPDLNYGAFTNLKEKLPAIYIYKKADKILVVDSSLKDDIIKYAKVTGKNIDYIPTGYDADFWKAKGKKENIVLTVAMASDMKRVKLKGLDVFIKSAKYVKEAKFIIIGVKDQAKKQLEMISPSNVELIEFLPEDKLLKYYQIAKVYCQLSLREGLPNTLCEAMLCECIPVGTKCYGIKTAIGDTGSYVEYGNEKTTADTIKKALKNSDQINKKARKRIKELFSLDRRRKGLVQLINKLT